MSAIEWVAVIIAGVLGRLAGGANTSDHWLYLRLKGADTFLIGIIAGYLVVGFDWLVLLCSGLAGWLGEKPGVGHPKGYAMRGHQGEYIDLERWQPEALRHHPYFSLALRGAIWGAAYLPLVYFNWYFLILVPAYAVAMPAAMYIGHYFPDIKGFAKSAWEKSESLQQAIVALLLIIVVDYFKTFTF